MLNGYYGDLCECGYGGSHEAILSDPQSIKNINIKDLQTYGIVNYYRDYAGEPDYSEDNDDLTIFKWFNAYLYDKKILLIDRVAYCFGVFPGDIIGLDFSEKEDSSLEDLSVTIGVMYDCSKGIKFPVTGGPFEYILIDLESDNVETLDMRDYEKQHVLEMPVKTVEQLSDDEKDLYSRITII